MKRMTAIFESLGAWKQLIGIFLGGVFTVIVAMITVKGKSNKENQDDCVKALKSAIAKLELLEDNILSVKAAFRVAFDEYEVKWKDNPENMGMLKTLRDIINK